MSRTELLERVCQEQIIGVVREETPEAAAHIIDAYARNGIRIVEITLTHAASRSSRSARASFSASSSVAQVLRTIILSVMVKKLHSHRASNATIIMFQAPRDMKVPLIRLAYVMVFLAAVTYAFFAFPKGMRAWQDKQRQIQELEQRNAAMAQAVGRGHNDFKIELAKRTLCRTLAQAAQVG